MLVVKLGRPGARAQISQRASQPRRQLRNITLPPYSIEGQHIVRNGGGAAIHGIRIVDPLRPGAGGAKAADVGPVGVGLGDVAGHGDGATVDGDRRGRHIAQIQGAGGVDCQILNAGDIDQAGEAVGGVAQGDVVGAGCQRGGAGGGEHRVGPLRDTRAGQRQSALSREVAVHSQRAGSVQVHGATTPTGGLAEGEVADALGYIILARVKTDIGRAVAQVG